MVQFGLFADICKTSPLPLCSLVEQSYLNGPSCYARSIDLGKLLIFQPATIIMQIVALIMTAVMIYNIKTKYTAVGRKEMVMFFYLYMLSLISEFLVISGVIQTGSSLFPYFASAYYAIVSGTVCCLMLNGFVGFQFTEDGTFWSVWSIRLVTFLVMTATYLITLGTFTDVVLSKEHPTVLWIWVFLFQALALLIYVVFQIILIVNTLDTFWPIGNIILGALFYILGQVFLHTFSSDICQNLGHYTDGMFFYVICTLLSVMMIYKYWDSITKEDLEFSVSDNHNVWEVKEINDRSARASLDFSSLSHQLSSQLNLPSKPYFANNSTSFIASLNISKLTTNSNTKS